RSPLLSGKGRVHSRLPFGHRLFHWDTKYETSRRSAHEYWMRDRSTFLEARVCCVALLGGGNGFGRGSGYEAGRVNSVIHAGAEVCYSHLVGWRFPPGGRGGWQLRLDGGSLWR